MSNFFYTYYSYEPFGRGYIGSRGSQVPPEEDPYLGSFTDGTFTPTEKIILSQHQTRKEALECEIKLHNFFEVSANPHFANRANASTSGLCSYGMIRVNNGEEERLVYPSEVPEGWVKGRLINPSTYVPVKSGPESPFTGKGFRQFESDVSKNPDILLTPIRELGERYNTSHTSICRWKKMLDRSFAIRG